MEFDENDKKMFRKYLLIIKEYCSEHECDKCKFYDKSICSFCKNTGIAVNTDIDQEKLLKHIGNIIANYCRSVECDNCVFRLPNKYCGIGDIPKHWNIKEIFGE